VRLAIYIFLCALTVTACSSKPSEEELEAKYLAMEMAQEELWEEDFSFAELEEFATEDSAEAEEAFENEYGDAEYLLSSYPSSCTNYYYWLPDTAFSQTTLMGSLSLADRERLSNSDLEYWDLEKNDYYTMIAHNSEENSSFTVHVDNKDGTRYCFLTQTLGQNNTTNIYEFDSGLDQLNLVNHKLPSIKLKDFIHMDQGIRYDNRFNSSDYISLIFDQEIDEMTYVLDAFHFGLELSESGSSLDIDSNVHHKLILNWNSDSTWVECHP